MANSDKMEIEKELVRDGFAWRCVWYAKAGEFTDAEREAREKHRGLWTEPNPVPPSDTDARDGRRRRAGHELGARPCVAGKWIDPSERGRQDG